MTRSWLIVLSLMACLAGCVSPRERQWVRDGFDIACPAPAGFAEAAAMNGATLDVTDWSGFGATEQGWRIYAPKVAMEIGARCAPDSAAFAARLARWQGAHGLAPDGRMNLMTFEAMKVIWQARRPFVAVRALNICPDPPADAALATAAPDESFGGKMVLVRRDALQALRRMRAAARRDLGPAGADTNTLSLFSGYRSPAYDDARCLAEQNCNGVVRAQCSAHRTGLALDLAVGAAPGYMVDSSDGPNRLFQTGTPAYRWLVVNAGRFGFVNYVFEPWHWEWAPGQSRAP